MPPRFHVPAAHAAGDVVELPDEEAAHLTRVMRLGAGDRVRVFNGAGLEWTARVEEAGRQRVTVRLDEPVEPVPEARVPITLAISALKGDKMDGIVRDAVMLGAAAIQPVLTARAERSAAAIERGRRVERWQRIAVSSAKQCGRAVVPRVHAAVPLETMWRSAPPRIMLVEPGASAAVIGLRELPLLDRATVLVGPEGGWTADEVRQAADSGAMLVTLGALTLRADAVPLVALTALRVWWEDF